MIHPSHNGRLTLPTNPTLVRPAIYRPQIVRGYRNHPCIEALPDILDPISVAHKLSHYPAYHEEDRLQPDHLRLHIIWDTVQDLFVCDDRHTNLDSRVGLMLRAGYKGRNPVHPAYWGALGKKLGSFDGAGKSSLRSGARALGVVGISGGGKSTTLERILDSYSPPVIRHTWYQGTQLTVDQLVWLKLECPNNGSTKALCDNFLKAVDTRLGTPYSEDYGGSRRTKYELIPAMARIAAIHCLGLLVVDEIQVLSESKSGGAEAMLNFFVELINTIGVPIIMVGTYQATPILSGKFRQARRVSGYGDCVWRPMAEDDEWQFFVEALWKYDYLRNSTPLTAELSHALYEERQGIADLAVKVYALAQWRAITSKTEKITEAIIRSVALDSLQLSRRLLNALKAGDDELVRKIGDIAPVDMDDLLQRELSRRTSKGAPQPDVVSAPATQQSRVSPSEQGGCRDGGPDGTDDHGKKSNGRKKGKPTVSLPASQSTDIAHARTSLRGQARKRGAPAGQASAPGTLMAIAASTKKTREDLAVYDVLRQAGMMRPVEEFLASGGSA